MTKKKKWRIGLPPEQKKPDDPIMMNILCNRCGRIDRVDITQTFNLARRCPGYEISHIRMERVSGLSPKTDPLS